MNKQQLAAKIWQSANKMRSKIEANEYKDYILGFIFYKFISDKELAFLTSEGITQEELQGLNEVDNQEEISYIKEGIGYFIPHKYLFSTWLEMGNDFDISMVRDALSSFSRNIDTKHSDVYQNIFATLETGLNKLGESSRAQTKAVSDLMHLIKEIPMNSKQDYDVLGFIYEYLIEQFASNAGKKAGEFYTPHEVSLLMSELIAEHLKDRSTIEIYDPTAGSGSLLINIGQCAAKYLPDDDRIRYYAQELTSSTYNLTRMNLVMRGISHNNIKTRNADTLEDDWPIDQEDGSYKAMLVDAVVSNPPYSQQWNTEGKEHDPRYAGFGVAPKSKADYAFLLHDLYHLKPNGIMAIVLPHGVLFRGGEEGQIRKNLIEKNYIDAIIGLPANIFFGTGIPTIIMILKKQRETTDTLVIDASKGFVKEGKSNKLRACDIKRIVDTVLARKDVEHYAHAVSKDEIRKNDYNLNIPRYVSSGDTAESWDIYASMFGGIPAHELDAFHEYWDALPGLRECLFKIDESGYAHSAVDDFKSAVTDHDSVKAFQDTFADSLAYLKNVLQDELIVESQDSSVVQLTQTLTGALFDSTKGLQLIDKYEVYQEFSDQWQEISSDIEVIQSEGMSAVKVVEPNFIMKKVKGKDVEVADGYKGRVIPFDLAQKILLKDEFDLLKEHEIRIAQIESELEGIVSELSEEEKLDLGEALNDKDPQEFVLGKLKTVAKELKAEQNEADLSEDSLLSRVSNAVDLLNEKTAINKKIKDESNKLHLQTKDVIENLSDDQVKVLLEEKWITPLINKLNGLPQTMFKNFAGDLKKLSEKYSETFSDLDEEIAKTEKELSEMIDQLVGSELDMSGLAMFKSLLGGC